MQIIFQEKQKTKWTVYQPVNYNILEDTAFDVHHAG